MGTEKVREMINTVDALLSQIRDEVDIHHGIVRRHARHDFLRKTRVLELAHKRGGFVTVSDVERAEHCDRQIARATLSSLSRNGMLERVYRGRYRVPIHEQKQT